MNWLLSTTYAILHKKIVNYFFKIRFDDSDSDESKSSPLAEVNPSLKVKPAWGCRPTCAFIVKVVGCPPNGTNQTRYNERYQKTEEKWDDLK